MKKINNTEERLKLIYKYLKIIINILGIFIASYLLSYIVNTYLYFIENYSVKGFIDVLKRIKGNIDLQYGIEIISGNFTYEVFQILKILFMVFLSWIYYLKYNKKSIIETFHKYRYLMCVVVFFICLIFEFNGSAIGIYGTALNKVKMK